MTDDAIDVVLNRLKESIKEKSAGMKTENTVLPVPKDKKAISTTAIESAGQKTIKYCSTDTKTPILESGGKYIDVDLSNTDWFEHAASDLYIENCLLSGVDFRHSNFEGLQAKECEFINCEFEDASFVDSVFENCNFYCKDKSRGCDFSRATLKGGTFRNCNLSNTNFERADMFQCELHDCLAQGANFYLTNFTTQISRTKIMAQAVLKNSLFRYANFEGVYLEGCDLSGSHFVSVDFTNAMLNKCDLTNSTFSPSVFLGASMVAADLRNADISNLDIKDIDVSGVQILEWQQTVLLESIGMIVTPERR